MVFVYIWFCHVFRYRWVKPSIDYNRIETNTNTHTHTHAQQYHMHGIGADSHKIKCASSGKGINWSSWHQRHGHNENKKCTFWAHNVEIPKRKILHFIDFTLISMRRQQTTVILVYITQLKNPLTEWIPRFTFHMHNIEKCRVYRQFHSVYAHFDCHS